MDELGGIDSVELRERPDPTPTTGQVWSGSTRWRRHLGRRVRPCGARGLALPFVSGFEVAGVVEALGDGADVQPRDRVYASLWPAYGGFAKFALVSVDRLAPRRGVPGHRARPRLGRACHHVAGVIMVAVFLSFVQVGIASVKMIGVGLAAAVFVDATLVRVVVLPAAMALLGRANWWIPRWLDWLLREPRLRDLPPNREEAIGD